MHLLVLASGSDGNAALVRAGETHVLLDAGLPAIELTKRLEAARVAPARIDHLVLTHGHLDHTRAAGTLARRAGARVHCAANMMRNAALRKAPSLATLPIDRSTELSGPGGRDPIRLSATAVPHDADPTVALRLEADGRALVLVTDLGTPDPEVARRLGPAQVLMLEFDHDAQLLRTGDDPPALKRRIGGARGHLSNAQAAELLGRMISPDLHTVVLAHLSRRNNTPELARAAAAEVLERRGRGDVRILIASQSEVGPNLRV